MLTGYPMILGIFLGVIMPFRFSKTLNIKDTYINVMSPIMSEVCFKIISSGLKGKHKSEV